METGGATAVEEETQINLSPRYVVCLFDNDKSTFEFIILLLQKVFHKTQEEAEAITMEIHEGGPQGHAVFIGSKEVCEFKLEQIKTFCDKYGDWYLKYEMREA